MLRIDDKIIIYLEILLNNMKNVAGISEDTPEQLDKFSFKNFRLIFFTRKLNKFILQLKCTLDDSIIFSLSFYRIY